MIKKLARGVGWLAAGRVLTNLVAFASTLLLARLLMPDDFGVVAIATTVAAVVTSLTELSMGSALVQHKDPQDAHFDSAFTLNIIRGIVVGGLIAALAYPIARLYGDLRLTELLLVIAATTALGGLANPKLVVFTRDLLFRQEVTLGVTQKLASFVVAVAIAWTYQSYWALVAGAAAAQLLTIVVSYLMIPYRPRFSMTESQNLLSFSAWLSLGQAVNTLNWKSDSLLAGYFLGAAPLGFYSFGDNLASLPTREATAPVAQTLFPAFARMVGDAGRLRAAYRQSQTFLCALALPVGCGFAMIAEPLIAVTVGEKWLPAVFVIQMLSGVFAVQALGSTLQPLAMAMGRTRTLFHRDLINFGIRIPLILIGLFTGGLVGIVWARVVSGLTGTLLNMMLVRTLIGLPLRRQLAANSRALLSVTMMVAAIWVVQRALPPTGAGASPLVSIAISIVAGGAVYLGATYASWLIAGRPKGPEQAVLNLLATIFRPKVEPA